MEYGGGFCFYLFNLTAINETYNLHFFFGFVISKDARKQLIGTSGTKSTIDNLTESPLEMLRNALLRQSIYGLYIEP